MAAPAAPPMVAPIAVSFSRAVMPAHALRLAIHATAMAILTVLLAIIFISCINLTVAIAGLLDAATRLPHCLQNGHLSRYEQHSELPLLPLSAQTGIVVRLI
jgi:hypothetical protein